MLPPWSFADTATVAEIGEHALIAWIRAAVAAHPAPPGVLVGIGDDAAVVMPVRNHAEVLTTDIQVEDVHFAWAWSTPEAIGRRALHVNLSDLAAMGATPRLALLSLGLPGSLSGARLHGVLGGLLEAAREARVALVGGNVSRADALVLDLTLSGAVKARHVLRRDRARAGDEVYVSGTVGGAAAGLAWLQAATAAEGSAEPAGSVGEALTLFRAPTARVALGVQVARNRAASACMDTSDGLADALQQIGTSSGVGMRIERSLIPQHPAVAAVAAADSSDPWALALAGGEDYELVFTVPRRVRRTFLHATGRRGLPPVTRIGVCTREPGLVLVDASGAPLPMPSGYEHFRAWGAAHA